MYVLKYISPFIPNLFLSCKWTGESDNFYLFQPPVVIELESDWWSVCFSHAHQYLRRSQPRGVGAGGRQGGMHALYELIIRLQGWRVWPRDTPISHPLSNKIINFGLCVSHTHTAAIYFSFVVPIERLLGKAAGERKYLARGGYRAHKILMFRQPDLRLLARITWLP